MKAIVLFGDGICSDSSLLESVKKHNLDQLAARGCAGLLVLRLQNQQDDADLISASEVSQLLNAFDDNEESRKKPYGDRYRGMKLCLMSNIQAVVQLGDAIKVHVSQNISDLFINNNNNNNNDDMASIGKIIASRCIERLYDSAEHCDDIVIVHLGANNTLGKDQVISVMDSIVGILLHEQRCKDLYLSVVAGYGKLGSEKQQQPVHPTATTTTTTTTTRTSAFPPQQSYTLKNTKPVPNLRENYPLIAAYYHETAVRLDRVTRFTEAECAKLGANGKILADHFIQEVAYKLGFTPKYGA